ncbi:MAG: glycosyltransferase [Proteobacteria bacterium]|nr:glycosyltransferase [Pseudomonadota bacterium]
MRVAFYAPLKPPGHPVPSGDRRLARLLMAALARGGHEVDLACRFRSWEGIGDGARIRRLQALGEGLARRLIRRYRATEAAARPEAWFTYHAYHKAPDWVGPEVSDALSIPYLLAEASVSAAQAKGPWSGGYHCTVKAVKHADAVIGLNSADAPGVLPLLADPDRMIALRPFLDVKAFCRSAGITGAANGDARDRLAARYGLDREAPWLLGVAMMRDGDKLASYAVLAEALAGLSDRPWQLIVVGDGPARQRVERSFAWAGAERVRFTGRLGAKELAPLYGASDVFVWPAVNEAFGMAILEAQAAGLPVVAGNSHGVRDIVRDGETGHLTPEGDAPAFAAALSGLLDDPARRAAMARCALFSVGETHDIAGAADTLNAALAIACQRQRS